MRGSIVLNQASRRDRCECVDARVTLFVPALMGCAASELILRLAAGTLLG